VDTDVQSGSDDDRTFLIHQGGKITVEAKTPLTSRDELSMAYTPGVARVSEAIASEPGRVWDLTVKGNSVAVVTDGTAVLGLGDIGPEASLPVMEGKAMLFREFGGINAWPIALDTTDPDEIVAVVRAIAPGFGGINLEDISSPRCFEIERRLDELLDIPVFHDDQHGTAIVVLAALVNALEVVGKSMDEAKVVITGAGAAGFAVADVLTAAGVKQLVVCDRGGAIHLGRSDLGEIKDSLARWTNPAGERGSADQVVRGSDVFIGLSGPGAVSAQAVREMAPRAIVFALANPVPEVIPEEVMDAVAVFATGRSDYANQINNVLAFPGVFRGALDVGASAITPAMKVAAGAALASVIEPGQLRRDYVIPSVFDPTVVTAVASAVAAAAQVDGVARRYAIDVRNDGAAIG
jgi:malate dehydrogenase (oxaloacetate-decarboxylating)